MKIKSFILILITSCTAFYSLSIAQLTPAFPGAEGFGTFATGGRGGDVYIITNLNDDGPGSLREAIEASGPRTVVFAVSGTIELKSTLAITNNDITIAGQSAPGEGICLKNYNLSIYDVENVIVRYIRSRLGVDRRWESDAMNGRKAKNIIVDHCSFSWSVDETVGNYDNEDLTIQWCIISESLHNSYHSEGPHGMGVFIGGQGISFHHNLLAHHFNRLPRLCGSRYSGVPELEMVDLRNNIMYNWVTSSCYGGEGGNYNIINNFYKTGPATYPSVNKRIVAPRADDGSNAQAAGTWGTFYVSRNYVEEFPEVSKNNWLGVEEVTEEEAALIKSEIPFKVDHEISPQSAPDSYNEVLKHSGASFPKRDAVDARVTEDTRSGTATYGGSMPGIIDHPADVGGYPQLQSTTPLPDMDKDGMPDSCEEANDLNKNNPEDGKLIRANGYSNLEIYLNSLVGEFKYILRPAEFKVSNMDFISKTISLTWNDISDDEEYFSLERSFNGGDFQQIAVLNAGTESYLDEEPDEYGEYSYRLKTVNQEMESCYSTVNANLQDPVPVEYSLTININGSGNVLLNPAGNIFQEGTTVGLIAEPSEGWDFEGWMGDLNGPTETATLMIDSDKTVTANFISLTEINKNSVATEEIKVYPLPFRESAVLSFHLEKGNEIDISLFNLQGQKTIQIAKNYFSAGSHQLILKGSSLKRGIYFLKISYGDKTGKKLVVIN